MINKIQFQRATSLNQGFYYNKISQKPLFANGLNTDSVSFSGDGILGGKGLKSIDPRNLVDVPMDWEDGSNSMNPSTPYQNNSSFSPISGQSGMGKLGDKVKNMSAKEVVDKAKEFAKDPKGFVTGALGGLVTQKLATTSLDEVLNDAKKTADTVVDIKNKVTGKATQQMDNNTMNHNEEPSLKRFSDNNSVEKHSDHTTENNHSDDIPLTEEHSEDVESRQHGIDEHSADSHHNHSETEIQHDEEYHHPVDEHDTHIDEADDIDDDFDF